MLVLLALGAWPWIGVCALMPQSYDAAVWMVNGLPSNPTLWNWVLGGPHFIGYRPLTALSFTIDGLIWGLNPLGYNLTNLALHLATACAVAYVTRRLAPDLPKWVALIAMCVFLAHPVAVEVAPQVARRSYALATLLALIALGLVAPSDDPAQPDRTSRTENWRWMLAALAVALATWAHEFGIIMAVVIPAALWLNARSQRAKRSSVLLPAGVIAFAGAVALASGMLAKDGIGGHVTREPLGADRFLASIWYSPKYLLWLDSLTVGEILPAPKWLAGVVGFAAIILLAGLSVRPRELLAQRERRASAILFIWIAGLIVLFGFQGVWYGRLVYPVAAPWAILLALMVVLPSAPRASRIAGLIIIAWLMWHSPLVRGLDSPRMQHWTAVDRVLRQAESDLNSLPGPAFVRMVLPYHPPPRFVAIRDELDSSQIVPLWMRAPETWLAGRRAGGQAPIQFRRFLFVVQENPELDELPIEYEALPAPALQLAPQRKWHFFDEGRNALLDTESSGYRFLLNDLKWTEGVPGYVYLFGQAPVQIGKSAIGASAR